MKVLLASPRGFCAGVDRAIEIVEAALERYGAPVYVRHEIVHNRHVVEDLRHKGAVFVDEPDQAPAGARLIFSAHGVSPAVRGAARDNALDTIDATCPLVTKVHNEVARMVGEGYELVMIGHAGHRRGRGNDGPGARSHAPGGDGGGRGPAPGRGPGPAGLRHPDDAVGRRHPRDHGGAAPALPRTSCSPSATTSATRPRTGRTR